MNLFDLARTHMQAHGPIGVAIIGAGKFASMFLAQIPTMPGIAVRAIADLDPDRARARTAEVGWDAARISATRFVDSGEAAIAEDGVEVVVEATGDPVVGIRHALRAIALRRHVVMVNVEADVLAGPALAQRAREAGIVYSLAYGDQPALIAELVDWARACGFGIAAAGKGTKYLPEYHASTPDTVWQHYGLTTDEARAAGMNPQMFNSFLDGTKSAIEMAAVANACGLDVPRDGLAFPPCGADELADVLCPREAGGVLEREGLAEVVSSLTRDGDPVPRDLRWGVYVVLKAPNAYAAACFRQYGLRTDASGVYAGMYRPYHLIGLELGVSIYSAALRNGPTGAPRAFRGDVVAVAKRDLMAGDELDGEGGYTVWGKVLPAATSAAGRALPIGFAKSVRLKRDVAAGATLTLDDVEGLPQGEAGQIRDETVRMAG